MATEDQLIEGLRRADAAGHAEDAQHFADQIKAMRAASVPTAQQPDGMLSDIGKSVASGLAQGVAGVAGLPGDIARGGNWLLDKIGAGVDPRSAKDLALLGSSNINKRIQETFGQYHEPQTVPGEYARTIASFAPAAVAPGGVAQRIGRVVIPAIASETGGQLTKGTPAEPYARIGGAIAGGLAADPAIRSINAVTSRLGVPIQNPTSAASSMLSDAIRKDGGPDAVNAGLQDWRGASNPALVDVTGNNVRRLVRSAASGGSGEAQNVATTYADRVAGNLQDNSLELTRRLTPGVNDSADAVAANLSDTQRSLADQQYRAPYAQPANMTDEAIGAMSGPDGQAAIRRALRGAQARQDVQQAAELQGLLDGKSSAVSSGALDRVRIAMRERAGLASRNGANDIASGLRGRTGQIDSALDATPGLKEARSSYANFSRQQEALDVGRTGMNASPDSYAQQIQALSQQAPEAQGAAGVGYRQALTDAIQRPAEGATGTLNRIATSTAQQRNLEATFGQQAASDYQTGIGNEIDRVKNARFISPNTGSQTELRLQDAGLMNVPIPHVPTIAKIWDKIRSSTQLTNQERTELVRLGTTEARLVNVAQSNPSLTSRALTTALISRSAGPRQ